MEAIFEALIGFVLELIGRIVLEIVLYFVALPIAYLLLTPAVLIFALFGQGIYWQKVRSGYRGIRDFWEWGGFG